MTAHAPAQGPVTIALDEVLQLRILGNSGLGVKFTPECLRDQDTQALAVRLLDRVASACQQVGRFPSLFIDFTEMPKLLPPITSALIGIMDSGCIAGDFFYCGVDAGSAVHRELEESGLLAAGFVDPGTNFLPAGSEDREKFGRLVLALQASGDDELSRSAMFERRKPTN